MYGSVEYHDKPEFVMVEWFVRVFYHIHRELQNKIKNYSSGTPGETVDMKIPSLSW